MEKEDKFTVLAISMMANEKIIMRMDQGFIIIKIENTQEIDIIINKMVKVKNFGKMAQHLKEILKMLKRMVKLYFNGLMDHHMKAILK